MQKWGGGILSNTHKGFTLIELLAVIVILAVIALIATPIVLKVVNDARKSAAKDSAYGYIKAVEYANSMSMLDSKKYTKIEDGIDIEATSILNKINLKGTKPTSGELTIEKGTVTSATLCINNYKIVYDGNNAKANGKCSDTNNDEENISTILEKAKTLVYENDKCKTDGTTYNYMDGCYIKGANTNNYVWYNGFMWRIMGINSDKTVRLITDEDLTAIPYGASNTAENYTTNEGYINDWLNEYFYSNLNSTKSIIKKGNYFCSENLSEELTDDTVRTTCTSGHEVNVKVGIISIDEYYLSGSSSSYLNIGQYFWTMTPYSTSNAWNVYSSGSANSRYGVTYALGVRPVINVESTSTITEGDGTTSNYFVLEDKTSDTKATISNIVTSGEYVKLEGKTYRVVSKESDGVKLILDGYYNTNIAYGSDNTFTLESGIGATLNGDVLTWLGLSDSEKIVTTVWYQADAIGYGFKYTDILNSTSNGIQTKVGLIRVGEMLSGQSSTILTSNYTKTSSYGNAKFYWTMNKYASTSNAWGVNDVGTAHYYGGVANTSAVRPVIKVKNNLSISKGNGTWNNPYEI